MRENESYKRLGLQLAKYRIKTKPIKKPKVTFTRIEIGSDFFIHDTHKRELPEKAVQNLLSKVKLYDVEDIQREIEYLTEDEREI